MKNKTAIARERFRDLEDFGGRSPRRALFSTTSSSRRFFARPSSVSLDATGLSGP